MVNDKASSLLVLDVARRNVAVSRRSVEMRVSEPDKFSIVIRNPDDPRPANLEGEDLGLTYAVCPRSRVRVAYTGHPDTLECPICQCPHPVDWESSC